MTSLAAALLALAVAAGPSDPPRRTGIEQSNAARAKAGLLPRKAPTRTEVPGRRLMTVRPPSPTYLAEPAPLAESAPLADEDGVAKGDAIAAAGPVAVESPAAARQGEVRLVAGRGRVETIRLPAEAAPAGSAAVEPIPAALAPPEEVGVLRAAAAGVVTEVTLRMRFD